MGMYNAKQLRLTVQDLSDLKALQGSVMRSRELPPQCLLVLITVALKPGLSVNELADALDLPQQTASRNASILLGRYETNLSNIVKTPFLQQTVNGEDPKKRSLELTNTGIEYLKRVLGD